MARAPKEGQRAGAGVRRSLGERLRGLFSERERPAVEKADRLSQIRDELREGLQATVNDGERK